MVPRSISPAGTRVQSVISWPQTSASTTGCTHRNACIVRRNLLANLGPQQGSDQRLYERHLFEHLTHPLNNLWQNESEYGDDCEQPEPAQERRRQTSWSDLYSSPRIMLSPERTIVPAEKRFQIGWTDGDIGSWLTAAHCSSGGVGPISSQSHCRARCDSTRRKIRWFSTIGIRDILEHQCHRAASAAAQ